MQQVFSTQEAISFAWEKTKTNLSFFISFLLVFTLIYFTPGIISLFLGPKTLPGLNFIFMLIYGLMHLGVVRISCNFYNNRESKISDLFSQYPLFFKYLIALIVNWLLVYLGLLLLIIPGIYLTIRLWFFDYFIVDQNTEAIESLQKSWQITRGNELNLFIFFLALFGINVLGMLFLLVGLFLTIPISMVASAFVYYQLLPKPEPDSSFDLPQE